MKPDAPYRPALRGLVFGLSSLGVKVVALVWMYMQIPDDATQQSRASALLDTTQVMEILGVLSTCVALVGVGYSAIAAHRGEWGIVLVLAWVSCLLGVFYEAGPFVYTTF